jgi:hypothetical protein
LGELQIENEDLKGKVTVSEVKGGGGLIELKGTVDELQDKILKT